MALANRLVNRVKEHREIRGWSQAELAERTGLSRAGISAIEGQRLVPSVEAALAIANAFTCAVEELFGPKPMKNPAGGDWAWNPVSFPCRFWTAEVGGRTIKIPVEFSATGCRHDGLAFQEDQPIPALEISRRTLVVATCDPAAGLFAKEYEQQTGLRMLVLTRSSQVSWELLEQGLVHVAGLHWADATDPTGNAKELQSRKLRQDMQLLHLADWQEGLAIHSGKQICKVRQATATGIRWIGREIGAGARKCQDSILGDLKPPLRTAADHRGIVEAIRNGWADVGVCVRLASEDRQLHFIPISEDRYELCFPSSIAHDPRLIALMRVVRSESFRKLFNELPGYRITHNGDVQNVTAI